MSSSAEGNTGSEMSQKTTSHCAYDVVATLNQRHSTSQQRRMLNVVSLLHEIVAKKMNSHKR